MSRSVFPRNRSPIQPCLPKPAKEPPAGPDWIHESKHDGVRILGRRDGNGGCTNPLFAASLPDGTKIDRASLCDLPRGQRSPDLVFYAHIGGVPQALLHFDPASPAKSALTADDWVKILGRDPEHFDYSGIDPHMMPDTGFPHIHDDDDALTVPAFLGMTKPIGGDRQSQMIATGKHGHLEAFCSLRRNLID